MDPNELIGKAWTPGGRGPDAFDCWGLVMFWHKKTTGLDLPDFPTDAENNLAVTKTFEVERKKRMVWDRLETPEPGCVVTMGKNKLICHAGVFIGGEMVLHCSQTSSMVVAQTVDQLRRQWSKIIFYKYGPK